MTKKLYTVNMTPEEVIDRLQQGEVIRYDGDNTEIKLINGILVGFSSDLEKEYIDINAHIDIKYPGHYFEDTEPFQITETGLYKTRGGQKAFINYIYKDDKTGFIGVIEDCLLNCHWSINGEILSYDAHNDDIVSKWEE